MDISEEITEKADHIVKLLRRGKFFEDYVFILPIKLNISLQEEMHRKYKKTGETNLNTEEMSEIIFRLNREGLSDTIYELSNKGYLKMAVNQLGEIVYSLNSDSKEIELLTIQQRHVLESFYNKK